MFALDYASLDEAREGAERVAAHAGVIKVGLELYLRHGPAAAQIAAQTGQALFLDLKLHDIPQTVAGAVHSVSALGAAYLTVHASGGTNMLEAAVEAALASPRPLAIVAVTALTSLTPGDLSLLGVADAEPDAWVVRLADLAYLAGVRAFVCSPHEAAAVRARLGPGVRILTPGVRPAGTDAGDQRRVSTPSEAIAAGADALVVGRPIRDAPDPAAAAAAIAAEIVSAKARRDGS